VTVSGNNIQRLSNFAEKNNIKTIDSLPFNQFDLGSDIEHAHSENFKPLGSIYYGENEDMVAESLTIRQREKFAENEKNKGNDCLRASELSDALLHYTTSLKLIPSVAVFNNRALCNLKLKNYENAIKDCTSSLELEVSFKAFLRRSSGYCSTGLYQKAIEDIDFALEMDPESKEALLLRKQIVEKCMADKETSITQTRNQKTKIFIEEVENGSPVPQIQEVGETATSMKTKLNIIEVEDEESEDDF
jgi:tetratricopeptide (TPR) repeat protein